MTDELVKDETTTDTAGSRDVKTFEGADFLSKMWGEAPAQQSVEQKVEEKPAATTTETTKVEEKVVEQSTTNEWYKNHGWDSEDVAKNEIAELKKLKEAPPTAAEIKFENDQSKHIYELLKEGKSKEVKQFLDTQEKLDTYLSGEVNKDTATDIIKLGLKLKHGNLSDAEINFKFNKEFGIPKEPVIGDSELEEDFNQRKADWQERVSEIEMNKVIEAKLLQPELEKQKAQLVLPELTKQQVQAAPTQEDLDAAKKYEDAYVQSVDDSIKNFTGFSVAVKHEGVDLPITYGVTDEEKTALATQLKDFAKSNYDANSLLASRWVDDKGVLKAEQMVKDLSVLNNYEKAFQKFASDSSSKVLEAYLKGKKQINVNETSNPGTATINNEDKTELDTVRDQFFK